MPTGQFFDRSALQAHKEGGWGGPAGATITPPEPGRAGCSEKPRRNTPPADRVDGSDPGSCALCDAPGLREAPLGSAAGGVSVWGWSGR